MRRASEEMLPALKRGAMVTDVGSVKASVVRELESLMQKSGAHFVGSHPMAGAEKTGVGGRAGGFVRADRLRGHAHTENQPAGVEKGGTVLESRRFVRVGNEAGSRTMRW